jgi:hypothetical protein
MMAGAVWGRRHSFPGATVTHIFVDTVRSPTSRGSGRPAAAESNPSGPPSYTMMPRLPRSSTPARRATRSLPPCALLLALAATLGCGSDGGTGTIPTGDFAGTYQATQTNDEVACTPEALPAPELNDPAQYVQYGDVTGGDPRMLVRQAGSRLTVSAELDDQGRPVPGLDFTGSIAADGSFTLSRNIAVGFEGPRAGGHTFYVAQQASITGRFETGAGEPRMTASGTFTDVFRDGGASGPVFTTCTLPFTTTATRIRD